jgi:hypothetical protein
MIVDRHGDYICIEDLEAIYKHFSDRLLSDEAVYAGASAESAWLNPHLRGEEAEEERQNGCEPFRAGLEAALQATSTPEVDRG